MTDFEKIDNINDRIIKLLRHYGVTVTSFSKEIGLPQSNLANVIAGRRSKPSIDLIAKIKQHRPDISLDWLILGQGDMLIDSASTNVIGKKGDIQKPSSVHHDQQVDFLNQHIRELTQVIKNLSSK